MIPLIASCFAAVTVVSTGDRQLHGFDAWTSPAGDIFISEEAKDDQALLTHEVGHCLDFRLNGNPRSGTSPFSYKRNTVFKDDPSNSFYAISWTDAHTRKSEKGFVSDYAKTDCFEDFAETYLFFVDGKTSKDAIIKKKLKWMEEHLPE